MRFKLYDMKIFRIALVFSLLGLSISGFAQHESQFTNFMHNYLPLNPGYAGAREVPSFTAIYRNQWVGFEGAPITQALTFNSPLLNKRVGFGLSILHRTAGISNSWTGSMAYSYDLKITEDFGLRIGLHGLVRFLGIDFSSDQVILNDLNDPSTMNGAATSQYFGNFGIGGFATYKDIYFGASVPRLLPVEIGFNESNTEIAQEIPHAYFMAGGTFRLNESLRLRPAVLGKYVEGAPLDFDINMSLVFEKDASIGVSYRTGGSGIGESVDLLVYYQINDRIGLGMSYDFIISRLSRSQIGTFEALARYDLTKRAGSENISNPRFF